MPCRTRLVMPTVPGDSYWVRGSWSMAAYEFIVYCTKRDGSPAPELVEAVG